MYLSTTSNNNFFTKIMHNQNKETNWFPEKRKS